MSLIQKILFLTLCLSSMAFATFLPKTDLARAPFQAFDNNMTETEFNKILNQIQTAYAPVVTQVGGKLSVKGDWSGTSFMHNIFRAHCGFTTCLLV